jgi:hypothetical protein
MVYRDIIELDLVRKGIFFNEYKTNYGDKIMRIYPSGNKYMRLGGGISLYICSNYIEIGIC